MNSQPLVSVIIPFFNGEKFIGEAIESVLAQTYEHWELLLVNDGSSDNSPNIAETYRQNLPNKIRYLTHPGGENRGACASRNLGIAQAQGQYIGLLDCDDLWLPDKLTQQVAILASHPAVGMVYGPSYTWYGWTGEPADMKQDYLCGLGIGITANTVIEPPKLIQLYLQNKAPTPCPSNVLLRRQVIERVGGFAESWRGIYQLYEDQLFFYKVCLQEKVYISGESWDKYRKHPDSCVSQVENAGQADAVRLRFLNWQKEYFSQQGVTDPVIWQALEKAFWSIEHPRLNAVKQGLLNLGKKIIPYTIRKYFNYY